MVKKGCKEAKLPPDARLSITPPVAVQLKPTKSHPKSKTNDHRLHSQGDWRSDCASSRAPLCVYGWAACVRVAWVGWCGMAWREVALPCRAVQCGVVLCCLPLSHRAIARFSL